MASAPSLFTLMQRHPASKHEIVEKYRLVAEGGESFEKNKERFLMKRSLEEDDYKQKVSETTYTNYVEGILGQLISFAMSGRPDLENPKSEVADLATDCDGSGKDLNELISSEVLRDVMIAKRGFVELYTEPSGPSAKNKVRVQHLPEHTVLNWSYSNNTLSELVTFEVLLRQASGLLSKQQYVWQWVHYTSTHKNVYEYVFPLDTPLDKVHPANYSSAELEEMRASFIEGLSRPHPNGVFPLISMESDVWIMEKLYDPAVSHFNKKADLDFAIARSNNAVFVIHGREDPGLFSGAGTFPMGSSSGSTSLDDFSNTIFQAQGTALYPSGMEQTSGHRSAGGTFKLGYGRVLYLGPMSDAKFLAPPSDSFDISREDKRDAKDDLYRVVNQIAASIDSSSSKRYISGSVSDNDWEATQRVAQHFWKPILETLRKVYSRAYAMQVPPKKASAWVPSITMMEAKIRSARDLSLLAPAIMDIRSVSKTFDREYGLVVAKSVLGDTTSPKVFSTIKQELEEAAKQRKELTYDLSKPLGHEPDPGVGQPPGVPGRKPEDPAD